MFLQIAAAAFAKKGSTRSIPLSAAIFLAFPLHLRDKLRNFRLSLRGCEVLLLKLVAQKLFDLATV